MNIFVVFPFVSLETNANVLNFGLSYEPLLNRDGSLSAIKHHNSQYTLKSSLSIDQKLLILYEIGPKKSEKYL